MTTTRPDPAGVARCELCIRRACPLGQLGATVLRRRTIEAARGDRLTPAPEGVIRLRALHSGLVALAIGLPDGRRQLIELETAGDVICGGDGPDGACWFEVLSPSVICEIDYPAEAIGEQGFLTALFGLTHRKLALAAARAVALGRLDGRERICGFLTDMAARIGLKRGKGCHLHLPMSREDIADYLGLNAETVSRLLGRLKRAELVVFITPTEMLLPDLAALASMTAPLPGLGAGPAPEQQSAVG